MRVDLDRGVLQARHPDGFQVCMYIDDPGTYFDANGDPLTPEHARAALLDVDAHLKQRATNERVQAARERIEQEVAREIAEVEAETQAPEPVGIPPEYVTRNAKGEPRETHRRKMVFLGPQQGWQVIEKPSGAILAEDLRAHDAEKILLEQE